MMNALEARTLRQIGLREGLFDLPNKRWTEPTQDIVMVNTAEQRCEARNL